jgi:hypothetical protein
VAAGGGGDEDWKNIVGSEANLRQYLGEEGFRYCLNKTPEELEKEGDYGLLEKMFGATSNNDARMAARSYGRALTIDTYDAAKAAENKEWIAKYGYKRWGTSYMDKSSLEVEQAAKAASAPAAKAAPKAAPKASKPAFSFPSFGGGGGGSSAAAAPKKGGSAVKVTAAAPAAKAAPAKAAPAPAPKPKAAPAPTGPLSVKPPAAGKGNLDLLKNKPQ